MENCRVSKFAVRFSPKTVHVTKYAIIGLPRGVGAKYFRMCAHMHWAFKWTYIVWPKSADLTPRQIVSLAWTDSYTVETTTQECQNTQHMEETLLKQGSHITRLLGKGDDTKSRTFTKTSSNHFTKQFPNASVAMCESTTKMQRSPSSLLATINFNSKNETAHWCNEQITKCYVRSCDGLRPGDWRREQRREVPPNEAMVRDLDRTNPRAPFE